MPDPLPETPSGESLPPYCSVENLARSNPEEGPPTPEQEEACKRYEALLLAQQLSAQEVGDTSLEEEPSAAPAAGEPVEETVLGEGTEGDEAPPEPDADDIDEEEEGGGEDGDDDADDQVDDVVRPEGQDGQNTPSPEPEDDKEGWWDKIVRRQVEEEKNGQGTLTAWLAALAYGVGLAVDKLTGWFGGKEGEDEEGVDPDQDADTDTNEVQGSDANSDAENEEAEVPVGREAFVQNLKEIAKEEGLALSEDIELKELFVAVMTQLAKDLEDDTGIPWRVTFAQACLETGYGTSRISNDENNCFGMKASGGGFQSYDNIMESVTAYVDLLTDNGSGLPGTRYSDAFDHTGDPKAFLQALVDAGYAGNPSKATGYVDKCMQILEDNNIPLS